MKVLVYGEASASVERSDGRMVDVVGEECKVLHGLTDETCFSDYFDPSFTLVGKKYPGQAALIEAGVTGGYLRFEYDEDSKTLLAITEYEAGRRLTKKEEQELIKYTQGQWSDGIGEGFEQRPQRIGGSDYYVSAWNTGQVATVVYEEEGVRV